LQEIDLTFIEKIEGSFVFHKLGDSRKYPYPTMGSMNISTPLAFRNSKMLYPSCPLNSKIVNPSSPGEFPIFFQPFGVPV